MLCTTTTTTTTLILFTILFTSLNLNANAQEGDVYTIHTCQTLTLRNAVVSLSSDITLSPPTTTECIYLENCENVTIDGNEHTIECNGGACNSFYAIHGM